jgi:hypothetical protein
MQLTGETAAPTWLPFVILAIPVAIMLFAVRYGVRYRLRARAVENEEAARIGPESVSLGSAASVSDPSQYSWQALLKALAIRPEPEDGGPGEEFLLGSAPTMLGLDCRIGESSSVMEAHVIWGQRDQGQVFIRLGADERLEGESTIGPTANRHIRHITVLRVNAPSFELEGRGGGLTAAPDTPSEVEGVIERLGVDTIAWERLRIVGGVDGIVATRPGVDPAAMSWVFDLWLFERIARTLGLPALAPEKLGPRWRIPYGLGKSARATRRS